MSTYLGPFELSSSSASTINFDQDASPRVFWEFGRNGIGPLTTSGVQASGIMSSSLAKARGEGDWPDLQLFFMGVSVHKGFAEGLSRAFHLKRTDFIKYYGRSVNRNSFTQIVSLGRPRSRGYLTLGSTNPYDPLIIDPNYFENQEDVRILIEGSY